MIDTVSHGTGAGTDFKKTKRQKNSSHDSRSAVDRLPPHSPEGEQGILGCILLSPNDCMGECIEKLKDNGKEAFYDLRHQTIYEAFTEMFDTRAAIDIITLQQRLKDKGLLEQIGGIPYLSRNSRMPSRAPQTFPTISTSFAKNICSAK